MKGKAREDYYQESKKKYGIMEWFSMERDNNLPKGTIENTKCYLGPLVLKSAKCPSDNTGDTKEILYGF